MHGNTVATRRVVVLQTATQAGHYAEYKRKEDDLIVPIGPEAMYHAEKRGWVTCNLGELWNLEDYKQASKESQSRLDNLIDALDTYSKAWNPDIGLEMGRYYALQLWIIVGQIHYNRFIAYSIARCLQPSSMLVYTKDIGQPFRELRPDPDCIFADVLLRSGCFNASQIEVQRISEKREGHSFREKIVNVLPQTLLTRLREFRSKWQIRNSGNSPYTLLMIGGGYDWLKIAQHDAFNKIFSLHTLPKSMARTTANPPAELVELLGNSVAYAENVAYEPRSLATAIHADMILYAARYKELKAELARYDAVVTAVLSYPWDSYLAHIAVKLNIPVIVWQHGEKGQAPDVTVQYSELFYATDYLAYAPAIQQQYQSRVGRNRLVNVEAVGSIGKNILWRNGKSIVYATGKWFKTAVPFVKKPDPDERLFAAHKTILGYLDTVAADRPVVLKANNTSGLNTIPYRYKNIRVDYTAPFTALLETAGVIILDTPGTTLVEACSTKIPIFVLGGRTEYYPDFLDVIRRRVSWSETPDELVMKIDAYLQNGRYEADVSDNTYLREYCAALTPDEVIQRVNGSLLHAINRPAMNHSDFWLNQ